jgi:AhpD family alkylhydroperoxidase
VTEMSFADGVKKFSEYGLGEFLEIVGELSQESAKKGALDRSTKELITLSLALAKRCHRCVEIHSRDALKMGASEDEISQVKKIVLFLNAAPWHDDMMFDQWSASWRHFADVVGPIEPYVRELMALAIAVLRHHEDQLVLHTHSALDKGASESQLAEIMPIVLLMDGAPALSQIPNVMLAIEEYAEKT